MYRICDDCCRNHASARVVDPSGDWIVFKNTQTENSWYQATNKEIGFRFPQSYSELGGPLQRLVSGQSANQVLLIPTDGKVQETWKDFQDLNDQVRSKEYKANEAYLERLQTILSANSALITSYVEKNQGEFPGFDGKKIKLDDLKKVQLGLTKLAYAEGAQPSQQTKDFLADLGQASVQLYKNSPSWKDKDALSIYGAMFDPNQAWEPTGPIGGPFRPANISVAEAETIRERFRDAVGKTGLPEDYFRKYYPEKYEARITPIGDPVDALAKEKNKQWENGQYGAFFLDQDGVLWLLLDAAAGGAGRRGGGAMTAPRPRNLPPSTVPVVPEGKSTAWKPEPPSLKLEPKVERPVPTTGTLNKGSAELKIIEAENKAALPENVLPAGVAKNALTGKSLENVLEVQKQLQILLGHAIKNVQDGAAASSYMNRLKNMTSAADPYYQRTVGNAIQAEFETLLQTEQAQGRLTNIITNQGVAVPPQFPNAYPPKSGSNTPIRPDVRMSLGNDREAVWDLTTVKQAKPLKGHSGQYADQSFVDYAADLVYKRPEVITSTPSK